MAAGNGGDLAVIYDMGVVKGFHPPSVSGGNTTPLLLSVIREEETMYPGVIMGVRSDVICDNED